MTIGSCAAGRHEPGQVRKEAALSGRSRVLWDCLVRANGRCRRRPPCLDGGVTISSKPDSPGCRVPRASRLRSFGVGSQSPTSLAETDAVDKAEHPRPPDLLDSQPPPRVELVRFRE